ncbi:MAG: hypothetical protein ACOCX5_05580, partial [Chloroflexota bacterium]
MFATILRILVSLTWLMIRVSLLPFRFLIHLVRSPRYDDKVLYYSISPRRAVLPADREGDRSMMVLRYRVTGGGFYGASKAMIVDLNGSGGGAARLNSDGSKLATGSGEGGVNTGVIIRSGRLRVYPLIGAVGGGEGIAYQPAKIPATAEDPEHAKSPSADAEIAEGAGGVKVVSGVGIEYHIGGRFGFMIGARILFKNAVSEQQSRQPHLSIVFGLGRFGKA